VLPLFPSSQASAPTFNPSPHISVHTSMLDTDPPTQSHPVSTVHNADHPFPFMAGPLSHSSSPTLRLSPHISEQVSGFVGSPPMHW